VLFIQLKIVVFFAKNRKCYSLVFIEFFGPKKFNVFKVLAFVVFHSKTA